jgi:hypothetical protein
VDLFRPTKRPIYDFAVLRQLAAKSSLGSIGATAQPLFDTIGDSREVHIGLSFSPRSMGKHHATRGNGATSISIPLLSNGGTYGRNAINCETTTSPSPSSSRTSLVPYASAHNAVGVVLGIRGQARVSESSLREAIHDDPDTIGLIGVYPSEHTITTSRHDHSALSVDDSARRVRL